MEDPPGGLTMSELAEHTGVAAATLRSWEARHDFPRPQRLAGGHRRYARRDIELVAEVLRQRTAGLSLPAAISQATTRTARAGGSVFAALRRRHPGLPVQTMRKATLLALTRAIEDEYCARAEDAILFASFQRQGYYRRSEQRWNELARTARAVVVLADFPETAGGSGTPLQIPLPAGAPLQREWTLVCAAPDYPVCLTGWEFPGQQAAEPGRRFEAAWSADRRVVQDAAITCAQLVKSVNPRLNLLSLLPAEPPSPPSPDLQRATGLLTRMAGYLDRRTG